MEQIQNNGANHQLHREIGNIFDGVIKPLTPEEVAQQAFRATSRSRDSFAGRVVISEADYQPPAPPQN